MEKAMLVSSYTSRNIYLVYKLHHRLNSQPVVNGLSVYQLGLKKKSEEIFIDSLSSQNRETSYGHTREKKKIKHRGPIRGAYSSKQFYATRKFCIRRA